MKAKKESKRFSRKKVNEVEPEVEPISPKDTPMEKQVVEQSEELLLLLTRLLEDYGCDEMVEVEFRETDSPFFRPSVPFRVATEGDCSRNTLYRYVRKTENYKEKIRLNLMNIKEKKEIGGLEITGTLIDYTLFKVVLDLVKSTRTLTVLRLVDCSLKAEGIAILGKELGGTSIAHLYLDRNPVEHQNYYCILEKNESLRHLSLVLCHIDVKGARLLGRVLGPPNGDHPDHRLRSLNLSSNRIDSYAAKFIAQGLKWNRDLIFLSLAGNKIGNIGMEFIAKAMQLSTLEKWEKEFKEKRLVERTEKIRKMLADEYEAFEKEMTGGLRLGKTKYEGEVHFEESNFEVALQEYIKNDPNPINRDVMNIDENFVTTGNWTLRILDVSFNKIEEEGFEHLFNTLMHQIKQRKAMGEEERERSHLTSVNLMGNFFPDRSNVVRKINNCLKEMLIVQEEVPCEREGRDEESFGEMESQPETEESEERIETVEKKAGGSIPEVPQQTKKLLRSRGAKDIITTEPDEVVTINLDELLLLPSDSESVDLEDYDDSSKGAETQVVNRSVLKEQNLASQSNTEL